MNQPFELEAPLIAMHAGVQGQTMIVGGERTLEQSVEGGGDARMRLREIIHERPAFLKDPYLITVALHLATVALGIDQAGHEVAECCRRGVAVAARRMCRVWRVQAQS